MSGQAGDKRILAFFRPRPNEQSLPSVIGLSRGRKFMSERRAHGGIRFAVFFFLASAVFPSLSRAQVPVFKITTEDSSIKFSVKASVAVNGTFDKWDANLTFTSTDVTTGVLDIKIQADSINTGSGMNRPQHLRCAGRLHDSWSV